MGLNKKETKQYNIENKQYDWEKLFEPQSSFSSYNKKLENNLKKVTSKRKPIYFKHNRQPNYYNGSIRRLPNLVDIKEEEEEEEKEGENEKIITKTKNLKEKKKVPKKEIKEKVNTIGKTNKKKTKEKATTEKVPIVLLKKSPPSIEGSIQFSSSFISLPDTSPTLPKLEQLFLHSLPDHHIDQHQVLILPCPSQTLIDMEQEKEYKKMKKDEQYQRKERLKILSKIHYDDHFNEPPIDSIYKLGKGTEVKEIVAHSILEKQNNTNKISWWYRTQHFIVQRFKKKKKNIISTEYPTSQKKHHSFPIPLYYHLSFYFFLMGFLLPPLWILWPSIMKYHLKRKNHSMSSIDFKWKARSRLAFYFFLISILVIFIFLLIFYPQLLGYR